MPVPAEQEKDFNSAYLRLQSLKISAMLSTVLIALGLAAPEKCIHPKSIHACLQMTDLALNFGG